MAAARVAVSCLILGANLLVHAVKSRLGQPGGSIPPTSPEKAEVEKHFNDMKTWGGETTGVANINMYMERNTMTMTDTAFSFLGTMPAALLQKDEDKQKKQKKVHRATSPDESETMQFGSAHLGKYSKEDLLTMESSTLNINGAETYEPEITFSALAVPSLAQLHAASPTNMQMYDDELSMDATIFTMNVGQAATMFLQKHGSSHDSSVTSMTELNINMFMYGNSMSMRDTDFSMNVNAIPWTPTVELAGKAGGDLARLLLLTFAAVAQAVPESSADFGNVRETPSTTSVWTWLREWTAQYATQSVGGGTSANINMHMYDNSMSMENTVFSMNIGSSAGALLSTQDKTTQVQASNKSGPTSKEWKLYDSNLKMDQTVFTLDAGALVQESEKEKLPTMGPGSDINMYMYNNDMKMENTVFTMNVGDVSGTLLQTSSSAHRGSQHMDAKLGMTMNIQNLNINMYMSENDMSMKTTAFSWKVG